MGGNLRLEQSLSEKESIMAKHGYTLIELLIVFSIIGILLGVGIVAYNDFNKRQTLKGAALTLKNDLRAAQNKALAGEKPPGGCTVLDGYEVGFTATGYSFRAKCSPGPSYGTATTVNLPTGVNLTISPAGSVLFKVLSQGVDAGRTICLSGFNRTYKLSVTTSGELKDEGFTACP